MSGRINKIIAGFSPISLEEMDGVRLMSRTDTKFVVNASDLEAILESIREDYRVLDIKDIRLHRYESLYFDTPDLKMFRDHHNERPSRYKIRARKYVDSNLNFFEIKYKNNKGRTVKNRIRLGAIENRIQGETSAFLQDKSGFQGEELTPVLWSNCTRITLVNKLHEERLTIDIDLEFKKEDKTISMPGLAIFEVKQNTFFKSSIIQTMKRMRIKEGSISKYCFGVIHLFEKIRKNNFKPRLIQINKLLYERTA